MAGILQTCTISHYNNAESHSHYTCTLRHVPAPAVCTRTLAGALITLLPNFSHMALVNPWHMVKTLAKVAAWWHRTRDRELEVNFLTTRPHLAISFVFVHQKPSLY